MNEIIDISAPLLCGMHCINSKTLEELMASRSEEKDARVKKMADDLKPPKGKFKSMTIDAADNGYSVRTHREMPANDGDESKGAADNGGKVAPTMDGGMSNTVHPDAESVVAHVQKHIGKY